MCNFGVSNTNQAARAVRVAREELGGRVHADVGPERQRLADHRWHHCAVHTQQHPTPVGHLGKGTDVRDAHTRVGGTLRVNQLGLRGDHSFDGSQVSGVRETHFDARVRAVLCQQPVHAAIDVLVANDLIAARQQAHYRVKGRHARGKGEGSSCLSLNIFKGITKPSAATKKKVPQTHKWREGEHTREKTGEERRAKNGPEEGRERKRGKRRDDKGGRRPERGTRPKERDTTDTTDKARRSEDEMRQH